ncbi:MAG: IS1595 family transposase [Cellvibrionales bacterium]|nr:MAG: IS1595 family transposase [Cellvibrionales bacterium]
MSDVIRQPKAGRDYPQTWEQFLDWFPDESSCVGYLEQLRWPQGFVCVRCGQEGNPYRASRSRLMCRHCRHQCTVTAGTVFEKTRTSLRSWFAAVWYVTNQKQGVTALGLQRVLGLGSYQTAWTMLHRLRRAMIRPGREQLSGIVEVDETYVGGPTRRKGRRSQRVQPLDDHEDDLKSLVVIAVELKEPKGFGRVRMRRIADASKGSVMPFVREAIKPGSTIRTDGSWAYRSLPDEGYLRHKVVHLGSEEPAHITMPGVHRVASLLKRWLLGTHQGSVRPHQLDYYLDEYTFRFNRRTSRSRGLLFYRLLQQAVVTAPVTYEQIAKEGKHKM